MDRRTRTRTQIDPDRCGRVARSFVGGSRVRLHVTAGDAFATSLRPILRQLNFAEVSTLAAASAGAAPVGLREVHLVDGSLPDALEICRRLPAGAARILASSRTGFEDRRRCTEAGVDALVADPIAPRELADWLEHFGDWGLDGRATVLIVDDDELAAERVAALLAAHDIETEVVCDPTTIFDVLDRRAFDLVLMDLDMPQVNGVELARMVRLDRSHLSTPIVFLSAVGDTETQMTARRFGGDDFLSKRTDAVLLARQVEMRVERARVLRTLIERDGLTGLVDHLRFLERLAQELARSRRTGGDCTLVMIDVDHFKAVNDGWGHQTGDQVLRRLASSLVGWLRRTDVVGRYGGEEFAVLMLDTSPERAMPVIEAFRRHFAALEMGGPGGGFHVTFSAGLAGNRDAADATALVAAADAALYRAKQAGRDRVVCAVPSVAAGSGGDAPRSRPNPAGEDG